MIGGGGKGKKRAIKIRETEKINESVKLIRN